MPTQRHRTCLHVQHERQYMPSDVQCRSNDVSDTRLRNAGASAAMPSAPSSFPAATPTALLPTLRRHATPPVCTKAIRMAHTNSSGSTMSATPGCPTPAPVSPCPLPQAQCLQPKNTSTHRSVTTRSTSHTSSAHACQSRCVAITIAAYVLCRSSDVSDTSLLNAGASASMPSALSAFPATTPHIHSVTTCTASPCQHTSTAHPHHTRLLTVSNDDNEGAYVRPRFSDVSDTSLPNAGASAAMPSSPSSLSAATPHRQRYNAQYNALPMQLHCTHHHTRLQYEPRPQRTNETYVLATFSDVSDTSLPNTGASAAMPSAPNLFPATP